MPIRLRGPLAGIVVESRGHAEINEVLDCRLAVALLAWAPELRAAGVTALRHFSMYRPGARTARSGRVSGHAHGLAIDLGVVERGEESLDVLEAWESRDRGASPCVGSHEESASSATLRALVCSAVAQELFQVVLTPHHDRAHANHVHLELRPDVEWTYLR